MTTKRYLQLTADFITILMFVHCYPTTWNYIQAGIIYDHDPRVDPTEGDTIYVIYGQSQESIKNMWGQYDDEFTLCYEKMIFGEHKISARGIFRSLGNGIEDAFSAELQKFVLANPGSYPLTE